MIGNSSGTPLRLTLLSREEDLAGISAAWEDLLRRSATNEPMQSPAWLLPWWEVYGRNTGRELRVGMVRDGDRLVGLIPLQARQFSYRPGLSFKRLEWLGADVDEQDGVCSEYLHFIAEADREEEIASCFANALRGGGLGKWHELVLDAMDGEHAQTMALTRALDRVNLLPAISEKFTAPYIPLPGTWDEYLRALPGRYRRLLLKSEREFERWAAGEARFYQARTREDLAEGVALLRKLHGERWAGAGTPGGAFRSSRFDRFHGIAMPELFARGAVDLRWLTVRREPVAVNYNLLWNGKVSFYQSGRRLNLPGKVRVGMVLHAEAIRGAIAAGCQQYDFLGGAVQYKRQLALACRPLVRLRVSHAWFREGMRQAVEQGASYARRALRVFQRR